MDVYGCLRLPEGSSMNRTQQTQKTGQDFYNFLIKIGGHLSAKEKLRIEKRAAAWYNTTSTSPPAAADERSKLYEVHIYLQKS